MKILGIDPGTNVLGYAIIDAEGQEIKLIDFGILAIKNYDRAEHKLREIFLQVQELIENYNPAHMAIEAPFYGKNAQSMLKLGRAQGVAIAAGVTMGLEITEYAPKAIKKSVTGNGNASKEQVSELLKRWLKIKMDGELLDATDALATAVCHHLQSSSPISKAKGAGWKAFLKDNPDRLKGGT